MAAGLILALLWAAVAASTPEEYVLFEEEGRKPNILRKEQGIYKIFE